MSSIYESWGRYPEHNPKKIVKLFWLSEIPRPDSIDSPVLAYGRGKSYGDSCQNSGGTIIDTSSLTRLIAFDPETGLIRCEAGVTLAQILDFSLPRGWFLAATPGTKHITVGGAVANDVHGKNHHKSGTFGCHVTQFELLRSDGRKMICSRENNPELFSATIGGLGLTGLITWVEFKLKPAKTEFFAMEAIKFDSLEDFFVINEDSEKEFDYTVSWVDTTASGGSLGRGIYNRGNHADPEIHNIPKLPKPKELPFPFDAPFINALTVHPFNILYFNKQLVRHQKNIVHYNPFFYPLDAVNNWNRAYGKKGFLQYQFVLPFAGEEKKLLKRIMVHISESGMSSFLTVLKTFGNVKSPGMLSFPRPGITMAVDFKMNGERTLKKLVELDEMVKSGGGVLYPAKDARMAGKDFRLFYPRWEEFSKHIDPAFSSSFWRRVMSDL